MSELAIVLATAALMTGVFAGVIDPHVRILEETIHHWLSWGGAGFIALFTPAFYVPKRKRMAHRGVLLLHVYGGLLAFAAISFHFARHITRSEFVEPGTGATLYAAVVLSVITGVFMQHRLLSRGMREWRLLHTGAAVTFYLGIVAHVVVRAGWV